jgi:glyoxylase-like metal-dependent hydrolase (beta-lactamase superfamily II)
LSAITLAPGIHLVASGPLGISHPLDCHAHPIETASGARLVDAGVRPDGDRILDNVRSLGLDPRDVRQILLTHAHADHAGGAGAVRRRSHCSATCTKGASPLALRILLC